MKVCVPVTHDQGLQSPVSGHFGSAPLFVLVDTENGAFKTIPNGNLHHGHGMCQPLAALRGEAVDVVVVGGIGMGAMQKLLAAQVRVFVARAGSVADVLAALESGTLTEADPTAACAGHSHGAHARHRFGCGHAGPGTRAE